MNAFEMACLKPFSSSRNVYFLKGDDKYCNNDSALKTHYAAVVSLSVSGYNCSCEY